MLRAVIVLSALMLGAACASQAPEATATVAPADQPSLVVEVPHSDAADRAQALIDEMHRNEAATAKFNRENPYKAPDPAVLLAQARDSAARAAADQPSPTAAPAAATEPTIINASSYSSNVIAGDHDERWWKDEMHKRDQVRQESVARANAARASMLTARQLYERAPDRLTRAEAQRGYQDAEAAYQLAVRQLGNDEREIDGFRDVARRNGVPPGWLLWP